MLTDKYQIIVRTQIIITTTTANSKKMGMYVYEKKPGFDTHKAHWQ